MTARIRERSAIVALALLLGSSVAAETVPVGPPALEPLANREGRISWRAIAIGMQMREIASLLRVQLRTDLVMEAGCGGEALEIMVDGTKVLMGFDGHTRNASLHTLFIYLDPPRDRDTVVAALKRRLPELRYTPGAHATDLAEADNPLPAYRIGDPQVAVVFDRRGVWLSAPICLD